MNKVETVIEIRMGVLKGDTLYGSAFNTINDKYYDMLREGHALTLINQLDKIKHDILTDMSNMLKSYSDNNPPQNSTILRIDKKL